VHGEPDLLSLRMGVKAVPDNLRPRTGERRRYKFVYWLPKRGKWIVKCRGLSSSGLLASTQDHAAKLAAKALRCTVQSLLLLSQRGPPKTQPPRHFRNVCWDPTRNKWRVRHVLSQPRFATEQEAARVASRATKVGLAEMQLPCPKRTRRDTIDDLRRPFGQLMRVYSTSDPKQPCVPGDLRDLLSRPPPTCMVPGMLVPFVLSKFGPHRDALALAGKQSQPKTAGVADVLHSQFSAAVRALSGKRVNASWTQNVGRKNCHHSGLIMFFWKALGFLRPARKHDGKEDVVRLGLQQRRFRVCKLDPALRTKLESLDAFGQALLRAVPPKTAEQWEEEVAKLQLALKGPPRVAGFSNGDSSYRSLWLIRCVLIWKMRAAGISHLRAPACAITVRRFAALFPDQRGWILRLARPRHQHMQVGELFKALSYRGPPELFSMFTCLFGDTDLTAFLQTKPKEWLETHCAAIVKARSHPCSLMCLCVHGCLLRSCCHPFFVTASVSVCATR